MDSNIKGPQFLSKLVALKSINTSESQQPLGQWIVYTTIPSCRLTISGTAQWIFEIQTDSYSELWGLSPKLFSDFLKSLFSKVKIYFFVPTMQFDNPWIEFDRKQPTLQGCLYFVNWPSGCRDSDVCDTFYFILFNGHRRCNFCHGPRLVQIFLSCHLRT